MGVSTLMTLLPRPLPCPHNFLPTCVVGRLLGMSILPRPFTLWHLALSLPPPPQHTCVVGRLLGREQLPVRVVRPHHRRPCSLAVDVLIHRASGAVPKVSLPLHKFGDRSVEGVVLKSAGRCDSTGSSLYANVVLSVRRDKYQRLCNISAG